MLYAGQKPLEIQDVLGLDGEAYAIAMRLILEGLAKEMEDKPVEHWYAEQLIHGTAIIRKLDKEVDNASSRDAVSALKAQWDVRKDLMKMAKDFGIVEDGQVNEVGGGFSISFIQNMSNDEIQKELLNTLDEFSRLDKKFGNSGILDATAEELFSGDSIFDIEDSVVNSDDES